MELPVLDATAGLAAENQYLSMQRVLDEFNSYSARAPNAYLRPAMRPSDPASVRRWWRYAGTVALKQVRGVRFNWHQLEKVRPVAGKASFAGYQNACIRPYPETSQSMQEKLMQTACLEVYHIAP